MKTDINEDQLFQESLQLLEGLFPHETSDSILLQLQLAVERITFAGLTQMDGTDEAKLALCNHLLLGEVSSAMMQYVVSLAQANRLRVLEAGTGRQFIRHCINYYSTLEEVKFITAVGLPAEFQASVAARVAPLHAPGSKVVFQVSPRLVAGFTVVAKQASADYSLRTFMNQQVPSHVRKSFVKDMDRMTNGKSR